MLKVCVAFVLVGHVAGSGTSVAIGAIEEALAQVGEGDKLREFALRGLMKKFEGVSELTPQQTDLIDNPVTGAIAMLQQVKANLANTTGFINNEMTSYVNTLNGCNGQNQASINTKKSAYEAAANNQETDFNLHFTAYKDFETKCTYLQSWLNTQLTSTTSHNGECVVVVGTSHMAYIQDNVEEIHSSVTKITQWFSDRDTGYQTVFKECDDSVTEEGSKRTDAGKSQSDFETAVCQYRAEYSAVCEGRKNCFDGTKDTTKETSWSDHGNINARLAQVLDYAICLFQELVNAQAEKDEATDNLAARNRIDNAPATCKANYLDSSLAGYAAYTTSVPTFPDLAPCGATESPTLDDQLAALDVYPFATRYQNQCTSWTNSDGDAQNAGVCAGTEDMTNPGTSIWQVPSTCT